MVVICNWVSPLKLGPMLWHVTLCFLNLLKLQLFSPTDQWFSKGGACLPLGHHMAKNPLSISWRIFNRDCPLILCRALFEPRPWPLLSVWLQTNITETRHKVWLKNRKSVAAQTHARVSAMFMTFTQLSGVLMEYNSSSINIRCHLSTTSCSDPRHLLHLFLRDSKILRWNWFAFMLVPFKHNLKLNANIAPLIFLIRK